MSVVDLYRFTPGDGSSKDWAIGTDSAGVFIYYGKTFAKLRLAAIPLARCERGSVVLEKARRVREQLTQGYVALGQHTLAPNQRDLTPVEPGAGPPAAEPGWYWERRPRGATPPPDAAALYALCADVAGIPQAHGGVRSWSVECAGRPATHPWVIRLDGLGRGGVFGYAAALAPSGPADPPLLDAQGCGRGVVDLDQTRIAAWFFRAVSQRDGALRLADDAGHLVTPAWSERVDGPADPAQQPLLAALGLWAPSFTDQLHAAGGAGWFF